VIRSSRPSTESTLLPASLTTQSGYHPDALLCAPVLQSPWENAVSVLQKAFTNTIARDLSLVAIVVAGLTFAFGGGGSKRALAGVLFGVGMAIAAVNFLSWLFSRHLKHRRPPGRSIWRQSDESTACIGRCPPTDDARRRAKALLLCHAPWRRHQERPSFPHRYAERRQRSGSLPRIHQPLEAATSISTASIKRPRRRSRSREAEISASFSTMR
jgi:type IV secretory pathway VirB2 component (pilin)